MLDDYAARIAEGAVSVLVEDGAIIGVLVLLPEPDHLLLDNVALLTSHAGRGLGRRLMAFAEAEARRRGYAEIRLYTHALMHENIAMYPHLGYIEYARGRQAGYDRVFMRKRLA
jgi:GNAT superfamily N-acetyltransferase